jgi:hypothetical protein
MWLKVTQVKLETSAAIAAIPLMFKQLFEMLHEQTGWSFTLLAGGPVIPKDSKKIKTLRSVSESVCYEYISVTYPVL